MTKEQDQNTIALLKKIIWTAIGILAVAYISFESWQSFSIIHNSQLHASVAPRIEEIYSLLQEVRVDQSEIQANQTSHLVQLTELRVSLETKLEALESSGEGNTQAASELRTELENIETRLETE